jgi:hypothetical protein
MSQRPARDNVRDLAVLKVSRTRFSLYFARLSKPVFILGLTAAEL